MVFFGQFMRPFRSRWPTVAEGDIEDVRREEEGGGKTESEKSQRLRDQCRNVWQSPSDQVPGFSMFHRPSHPLTFLHSTHQIGLYHYGLKDGPFFYTLIKNGCVFMRAPFFYRSHMLRMLICLLLQTRYP